MIKAFGEVFAFLEAFCILIAGRVKSVPLRLILSTSSFETRRRSFKFLSNLLLTYASPLFFPVLNYKKGISYRDGGFKYKLNDLLKTGIKGYSG